MPKLGYGFSLVRDSYGNLKRLYSVGAVSYAVKKFIEDDYAALAEVSVDVREGDSIFLSAETLAFFFKALFTAVQGRAYLKLAFYSDGADFSINITAPSKDAVISEDVPSLIRLARDVGFECEIIEGGVRLNVSCARDGAVKVYVHSDSFDMEQIVNALKNAFLSKE